MSSFYPEGVLTRLPAGCRALINEASARHRISTADYVREALIHRLQADGLPVPERLEARRARLPATMGDRP